MRGSAGTFVRRHSAWRLLGVLISAYVSAFQGMGRILKKRRQIALNKRLTSVEFLHLIRKFKISARELASRNR